MDNARLLMGKMCRSGSGLGPDNLRALQAPKSWSKIFAGQRTGGASPRSLAFAPIKRTPMAPKAAHVCHRPQEVGNPKRLQVCCECATRGWQQQATEPFFFADKTVVESHIICWN